jgi:diguanylate cyclase (GGDEF)-like protein
VFSAAITAVAVAVPLLIVGGALWKIPLMAKLPILLISCLIPLFIAAPISVFALYIVKTLHKTLDRLDYLVRFDPLTGLLSRMQFLSYAEENREQGGYLILADADRFKLINDTYGHAAGDEALKHLAAAMQQIFGSHGLVARVGGEEFAIFLPQLDRQRVELLLATLGSKLRTGGFAFKSKQIVPTLSGGVVAIDSQSQLAAFMARADQALYVAKQNGRDQFVFDESLETKGSAAA